MKKRIFSVIICLFLLLSLTACGEANNFVPSQKAFDTQISASAPSTDEVIAKNDKYTLRFDSATGGVKLFENGAENETDGEDGEAAQKVWELCPTPTGEQEFDALGMPIKRHGYPQSVLIVAYTDKKVNSGATMLTTTYDGVLPSGRMVYKPIENGVTIEYYFDMCEFMIPVDYVLCDDHVNISIDSTKIQENDNYKIAYVTLAPFLSAVQNDTPDSYLFMPSGSGALINNKSISAQGISYSAYVYGDDLTMEEDYIPTKETPVKMPVYGYKSGDKGGFAIIDNGSDAAMLVASSGNTDYKFSTIYPTFQLRGYTLHTAKSFNTTSKTNIYPTNMLEGKFSIQFYPLSGKKANYSGMAEVYRDYLIENAALTENDNEKPLSINLIGGTEITKSFLGVPYKTIFATTTVDQSGEIISDISKNIKDFAVKLEGYGASGVDVGKIGGGYTVADKIGSLSDLKKLSKLCADSGVDLYMDYDVVQYSSSGNGFSYFADSVMNSGNMKSDQYIIDKAMRNNLEKMRYRLLKPGLFADAVSEAISMNDKAQIGGVSFETLSQKSYSDYSDSHSTVLYNARYGFASAVSKSIAQVKKSKQKLMASNANVYAATSADIISDTPISSDNGYAFLDSVPFYAMVFKGYVPMTTEPVNMAANEKKVILGAVEGGMGLNYAVTSQWDNSLINAYHPDFFSTVYSGVKDDIISNYNELSSYYESVKGAKIVSNTVISAGVHCTVFDNGVTVYVNYNSSSKKTPAGKIAAYDYIITEGGAAQ